MKQYKDACDTCGKFDYCKGHDGKVLCPECITKQEEQTNENN